VGRSAEHVRDMAWLPGLLYFSLMKDYLRPAFGPRDTS